MRGRRHPHIIARKNPEEKEEFRPHREVATPLHQTQKQGEEENPHQIFPPTDTERNVDMKTKESVEMEKNASTSIRKLLVHLTANSDIAKQGKAVNHDIPRSSATPGERKDFVQKKTRTFRLPDSPSQRRRETQRPF